MVDFAHRGSLKRHETNAVFHQADNLHMLPPHSQDLLIVNNVFNILSDQEDFLLQASDILKLDGLLIIADEFAIDDLPDALRNDPAFQCGGIAGAEHADRLVNRITDKGFKFLNQRLIRSYSIPFKQEKYRLQSEILIFKKHT